MEEGAINTPDSGRQKAKVYSPCSSSLSSITSSSVVNEIQQDGSSSVPSLKYQAADLARDTSTTLNAGTCQEESLRIHILEQSPSKYLDLSSWNNYTYHATLYSFHLI
jgi:hypothetical protein